MSSRWARWRRGRGSGQSHRQGQDPAADRPPQRRRHHHLHVRIPLLIELIVDLRVDKQRFTVDGDIALRATARAAEPLTLVIDVAKPRPSDIAVHVTSKSVRGEILRIVAGVDTEIRRFVAAYVADEIDSPASQEAKVIDVAEAVASAWD